LPRGGAWLPLGSILNIPKTGYGYIEADGQNVTRFIEKPDLANVKEYIAASGYY
jgi:mannose-1-phosphate guanylyltransferase